MKLSQQERKRRTGRRALLLERERTAAKDAHYSRILEDIEALPAAGQATRLLTLSTVIPAKNAARHIGRLIGRVNESLYDYPHEVVVVDDGSADNTNELARRHGAIVVSHEKNMGKGAAMKTGVRNSSGEIVVFIDSDEAFEPCEIPRVVAPILEGKADLVIGSRALQQSNVPVSPRLRRLANALASLVISITISFLLPLANRLNHAGRWLKPAQQRSISQPRRLKYIRITDCTSGFRAITREGMRSLGLTCQGFEVETEMIYEAARKGLVIAEVPISCDWDPHDSHLSVVRDSLRTLRLLAGKLIDDIRGTQIDDVGRTQVHDVGGKQVEARAHSRQ